MAEHIEPCPFGCKAGLTVYQSLDCEYVICDRCESTGPAAKTREAAIAAWNKRAGISQAQSKVQWWLAELDQYGTGRPVDGPHSDRAGADKAMYLFNALGLAKSRRYAVARIELFEPKPSAEGVNLDAIAECNKARAALRSGKEGA